METNCKPGDLALIIRGPIPGSNLVGRTLSCVRLLTLADIPEYFYVKGHWWPLWITDTPIGWTSGMRPWIPDAWLMPINPLNDETTEEPAVLTVVGPSTRRLLRSEGPWRLCPGSLPLPETMP